MIKVEGLSKRFKLNRRMRRELGEGFMKSPSLEALKDVSFECRPGRVFGLLGPNGAGKTTALRIIATMLRPSGGRVMVSGVDVEEDPRAVREKIGFLTGNTGLYHRLTALEMVRYHADLHMMPSALFESQKRKLFDLLDINDFADRRVAQLSSGMKQKVSIARTMISDPPVVVFDEPTLGLDVMTSRSIIDLIRDCRTQGKTVLFSTHQMSEVKLLCDDIAILHRGRLYFNGSIESFEAQMQMSTYEDEFIRLVGED